ncbi:aldehyde reductase ii [Ilyonectria robusta]
MTPSSLKIENPALPLDSVVAVSGANGFIASHIVDQLLAAGYRVRGTVRDASRTGWLQSHFDDAYGSGRFSLVAVPDITAIGAFDEALEGVHGVVHTLAITNLDPNPDNVVPVNVSATLNIAKSAAKSLSVTRFAYTSSSGAAAIPKPGEEYVVNKDTYNEEAVAISYSGQGPKGMAGGYLAYSAAKTKAEQALWKWYKEEKPSFVLNSIIPNVAVGKVLKPEHQGFPTTVGLLQPVWEGHLAMEMVYMFPARKCIYQDFGSINS